MIWPTFVLDPSRLQSDGDIHVQRWIGDLEPFDNMLAMVRCLAVSIWGKDGMIEIELGCGDIEVYFGNW